MVGGRVQQTELFRYLLSCFYRSKERNHKSLNPIDSANKVILLHLAANYFTPNIHHLLLALVSGNIVTFLKSMFLYCPPIVKEFKREKVGSYNMVAHIVQMTGYSQPNADSPSGKILPSFFIFGQFKGTVPIYIALLV